jgi:cellobiose-specific phosphotransferase system component IIC
MSKLKYVILEAVINAIVGYLIWHCGDYFIEHCYGWITYLIQYYCCKWAYPQAMIIAIVLGVVGIALYAWYRRNVIVIKI